MENGGALLGSVDLTNKTIVGNTDYVRVSVDAIACSPDGSKLATGSIDPYRGNTLNLWNMNDGIDLL